MLDLTDWQNKKYTTRDGMPVRVLCIDAPGALPICGLLGEFIIRWGINGGYDIHHPVRPHEADLINAKTKKEGWVNVYSGRSMETKYFLAETKKEADSIAASDRVACVKIEWEE